MNILLTGGVGYIGSHVALTLSREHHQVVLLDNFSNSRKKVLDALTEVLKKSPIFVEGDIRDTQLISRILRDWKIDAVIHLAGLKAIGESVENPIDYYANNVQGTISLLQAMNSENIKTLVFSSSATVYGVPQYLPIDEQHPLDSTNPYGRTKLHVEWLLKDLSKSDPKWSIICLRYFNPVGADESGLIGEYPLGLPNNLMPYLAMVANKELPMLNIYGQDYPTPDGTGIRDYIHVMDLAEGHIAALDYARSRHGWDVFNLGSGSGHSVLELISYFEEASGKKIPFKIIPRREGDVAQSYTNVEKAKKILNWSCRRNIRDMCVSAWKFELNKK